MNAREEAQRFLDQYRAAHGISSSAGLPPAVVKGVDNWTVRHTYTPEQAQDPDTRAHIEQLNAMSARGGLNEVMSYLLAEMHDHIEKTAATWLKGRDIGQQPLIGHLQTGQLNVVTMPGSEAYLVLFHDQMTYFTVLLSETIAFAMPRDHRADTKGRLVFKATVSDMTEQIEAHPEIADCFAKIVVSYAVTGRLVRGLGDRLTPDVASLAVKLDLSLWYFVLGHERAHIILGHLHTTAARRGGRPDAEVEALAYSWWQELEADLLGMKLSMSAGTNYGKLDFPLAFIGIGLFFDALDVMDRAVALLQTGDENACQLGSHPPCDLRKRYLRESLSKLAETDRAYADHVRRALELSETQSEIIRLLWERTRPILLDLHRRGVSTAHTWRTIPKETGDEPAPAPQSAPAPKQARRRGRSG